MFKISAGSQMEVYRGAGGLHPKVQRAEPPPAGNEWTNQGKKNKNSFSNHLKLRLSIAILKVRRDQIAQDFYCPGFKANCHWLSLF